MNRGIGSLLSLLAICSFAQAIAASTPDLLMSCPPDNDLCRVLRENGLSVHRFDDLADMVAAAAPDSGALILADGYPDETTRSSLRF